MGWDNTTEMVATVVDSITHLTRQYINAHSETPNLEPPMWVPRPYSAPAEPVKPQTISFAELCEIAKET